MQAAFMLTYMLKGNMCGAPVDQYMHNTGDFKLLKDAGRRAGANRYLLFGSDEGLQLLERYREWVSDGTFKACPTLFKQVYTVFVNVNGFLIPCVTACLPGKTKRLYKSMWEDNVII